jgi:hypothetical protein
MNAPLSFSAHPGLQGFEAWREAFALKIARVDVTAPDREHFSADIRVRPLPGVILSHSRVEACSLMRTPELVRDGDDAVALIMCMEGRADIRFDDDTAVLMPGQAILMPHHRLGGAMFQPASHTFTLRSPRGPVRSRRLRAASSRS